MYVYIQDFPTVLRYSRRLSLEAYSSGCLQRIGAPVFLFEILFGFVL